MTPAMSRQITETEILEKQRRKLTQNFLIRTVYCATVLGRAISITQREKMFGIRNWGQKIPISNGIEPQFSDRPPLSFVATLDLIKIQQQLPVRPVFSQVTLLTELPRLIVCCF
jgi:hypothetical protein